MLAFCTLLLVVAYDYLCTAVNYVQNAIDRNKFKMLILSRYLIKHLSDI